VYVAFIWAIDQNSIRRGKSVMDIQLKKGIMEICILAILFGKDTYECELSATLQKEFKTSEIIIFSLLKKLQKEGFIKSSVKKTPNRAALKFYSINSEGKDQFENLKYEWYELNQTAKQFINKYIG